LRTLTGAARTALGAEIQALFCDDDDAFGTILTGAANYSSRFGVESGLHSTNAAAPAATIKRYGTTTD